MKNILVILQKCFSVSLSLSCLCLRKHNPIGIIPVRLFQACCLHKRYKFDGINVCIEMFQVSNRNRCHWTKHILSPTQILVNHYLSCLHDFLNHTYKSTKENHFSSPRVRWEKDKHWGWRYVRSLVQSSSLKGQGLWESPQPFSSTSTSCWFWSLRVLCDYAITAHRADHAQTTSPLEAIWSGVQRKRFIGMHHTTIFNPNAIPISSGNLILIEFKCAIFFWLNY